MGECVEFLNIVRSDDSPLIPEGAYEMGYLYHKTWMFMGRQPKVVMYFSIIEPGDYFGVVLSAYYNVHCAIGKRCRNGGFKAKKRSNLVRDFCRVFPNYTLKRLDRIPISRLGTVVVVGTVETVTHGFDQREIPEAAQYSGVRKIKP